MTPQKSSIKSRFSMASLNLRKTGWPPTLSFKGSKKIK